jgi:hypothetical protein
MKLLKVSVLTLLIASSSAFARDYVLRLNMATCEPDGMINSWRERSSPRDFWIAQTVVLEKELEWMNSSSVAEECSPSDNISEKRRCMEYKTNIRASAVRCLSVSRRRCREQGAC